MIKRHSLIVVLLTLNPLLTPGLAQGTEDSVIASIGEIHITAGEVRSLINFQEEEERKKLIDNPSLLTALIKNEAIRRALVAESKKSARGQDARTQFLIEQQKDQVLIDRHLAEIAKAPDAFPGKGDIARFYTNNIKDFKSPAMVRLEQIYIPVPYNATETKSAEALKKILSITEELKSKKLAFSEAARRYSINGADEGNLEWLPETTLLPEIKAKVALLSKLPKETFSRPVNTHAGWSIIKLIDIKPEKTQTLAEATPKIVALLRKELSKENRRAYLYGLLTKTPVNIIDPSNLKNILIEKPRPVGEQ